GLIFIDTIVKKLLGKDVRMLQNHKFLAGSLGLGSGVMIFSSFYNLLPEARSQLSSDLSIFANHADAVLMLFFFGGVGVMSLIHWIMHKFDSGNVSSAGIESDDTIQQFIQRENQDTRRPSSLPQYRHSNNNGYPKTTVNDITSSSASNSTTNNICKGCSQEESDEGDDEERYNDSEYVDDEATSLLNNAFLQIGKTPSSCLDDTPHMQRHHRSRHASGNDCYNEDNDHYDDGNIEVVIGNQKDEILRQNKYHRGNHDLNMEFGLGHDDDDNRQDSAPGGLLKPKDSWSSISTRSQKPFAPVKKRRKSGVPPSKSRSGAKERYHSEGCPYKTGGGRGGRATPGNEMKGSNINKNQQGANTLPTYGAVTTATPHQLRRTSFPRLNGAGAGSIYSKHDNLDHAVADDQEHADLTEIGIQTALTIAVHKFPEGLITFLSTTADPCLGLTVFMAIAVHNLIEGYLIAFPLFIGLHSRTKAFALAAALGGLSQPLGAILGWFILREVNNMGWQVSATGVIYAIVAGMMSSITVNGMWPQAVKCVGRNKTKVVQYCFFGGIAIMGLCQAAMGAKCNS
ncbi:hypothetical protein BX616_004974, partial [Lobosporangium transversale]